MKNTTRSNIYLPMAAMILAAALALPAAAQEQVPFKGMFQGVDAVDVTAIPPTITTFGTGIGTLVGQFSLKNVTTVTLGPPLGGTGTGQWIAANGDSIDTEFAGTTEPVDMPTCQIVGAQPGDHYLQVTEEHKVTGGTGRFAGAQGSFTVTRYHHANPGTTHGVCGSFTGTITPPGAAQ
jgi:hypothetical protein